MRKGMSKTTFMQPETDNERVRIARELHAIVDDMLAPYGEESYRGTLIDVSDRPPFEIDNPSQHTSKKQLNLERKVLQNAIKGLDRVCSSLLPPDDDLRKQEVIESLRKRIDARFLTKARRLNVNTPLQLALKGVAEVQGTKALLTQAHAFMRLFEQRLEELDEQEAIFGNAKNRPGNPHTRAIALRLAKMFAQSTGKLPTLGTSGVDGKPSTHFTRALVRTFDVLGIEADHRSPAKWALSQLTKADTRIPEPAGLGLLGAMFEPSIRERFDKHSRKIERARRRHA